jgi:hypothetical protein
MPIVLVQRGGRMLEKPWEGERACPCGGAGMPCPNCNMTDNEPRTPEGFRTDVDKKGWRH